MIKNIVFDIGGVLADYRLKEFLFAKGFDELTIKRIIKASIMSPYWEQFERADITEEEALQAFTSLDPEIGDDIRKAYSNVNGMLTIRAFAVDLIKKIKEIGFKPYYLSNYSKKAFDECSDSLAFMDFMEGGVLSFQARLTKPNPEMYKLFLEKFNLNAEECVFVDDTAENVEVAKTLGFKGIVYESYDETIKQLAELGVNL